MGKKLELTWFGKNQECNIEPRILIEDKENSNCTHALDTENMIIHGDNLLALKALELKYAGKVKCIYIDPPYNTGSAFEHYDDNVEHSQWLNLMKPRLELLRNLLSEDGLIFVQIDDNEQAYLKVMMDEIFGRDKFLNCIAVKMSEASGTKMAHIRKRLPKLKEYILMYKKSEVDLNELRISKAEWDNEYKTVITGLTKLEIDYIKSVCKSDNISKEEVDKIDSLLSKAEYTSLSSIYSNEGITKKSDKISFNYKNAYRIFQTVSMGSGTTESINVSRKTKKKNIFFSHVTARNKLYIIKGDYDISMRKPRIQVLFADEYLKYNPCDFWTDIKTTGLDNEGAGVYFKNSKKPEQLIERVLTLATNENDLVLDSFLGSGTTAAVAHKMKRRYIGIEMGEHAYTHCKVRLDKVIEGSDQGGISKALNWQGGGGYKFYKLAPSLINKDQFDEYIINPSYDADMLAVAVALHEGFAYAPDSEVFWKQSQSNEHAYLFVTTRYVNASYLDSIHATMDEGEYLIIACKSYEEGVDKRYPNITLKKIPNMLLSRCEFGQEHYNLNIIHPPVYEEERNEDYEQEEDNADE